MIIEKPFIVENVRNFKVFEIMGLFQLGCYVYFIGRHTYWSNVYLGNCSLIKQRNDFKTHSVVISYDDMEDDYHQGGYNVHNVVERFLEVIHFTDFSLSKQLSIFDFGVLEG